MRNALKALQDRLGYTFQQPALLERALTHRSAAGLSNNERLEFLGDAVLDLVISDTLCRLYPNAREGELTRMRATLVRGDQLADLAQVLGLSDALCLGMGEIKSGGHQRTSILADAFEAVIGALYTEAGLEETQRCILQWYGERIPGLLQEHAQKDPKSALQEWTQAHQWPLPVYESTVTGDAHAQIFHVTCCVKGVSIVTKGSSTSRRKAEQVAAAYFLQELDND